VVTITSLNNINPLFFVIGTRRVFFELETEVSNVSLMNWYTLHS